MINLLYFLRKKRKCTEKTSLLSYSKTKLQQTSGFHYIIKCISWYRHTGGILLFVFMYIDLNNACTSILFHVYVVNTFGLVHINRCKAKIWKEKESECIYLVNFSKSQNNLIIRNTSNSPCNLLCFIRLSKFSKM